MAQFPLWSDRLQEISAQIGLSERTLQRADYIGRKLQPALREALRGTAAANNQDLLHKLARLEPAKQAAAAKSISGGSDAKDALKELNSKAATDAAARRISAVRSNFDALSARDRKALLQELFRAYPKEAAWALANPLDGEAVE